MKPEQILRSLYFENEDYVRNFLDENTPCLNCDGRCEKACPVHVKIKDLITPLVSGNEEKTEIGLDCLKTEFCGIPLDNPFLLSSSVVASTYDMCARAFDAGWAGAAFKTVCLMEINEASPRFTAVKGDSGRVIGFKNIEQLSDNTLTENIEIFRKLKQTYPTKLLLVSIMGRNEAEWAYLAEKMEEAGADALELNFSCPNMTQENTGSDIGQIPELVEKYTRVVTEHTSLPVLAKLTPNVTHIEESADAAIRGGASGVAAINTIKSLIEAKIDPADNVFTAAVGGYSGKAVKPIALRFIKELGQDPNLKGYHISGMGGIETWKDAMDFIAMGADSVQVTTAVMLYGYRIIYDLCRGAALFLTKHGIPSINDIRKIAVDQIVQTEQLDRSYVIYPKFLRDKCVGCRRCYLSCRDGGHQAITLKDGRPVLKPDRCVGCHLCVIVCPCQAIVSSEIRIPKKENRKGKEEYV